MNAMLLLFVAGALVAQQPRAAGVEQVLKPKLTLIEQKEAQDKGLDTWIIDEFVFVSPRMITVNVPAKDPAQERRLVWYMLYRVTNRSETPRFFVPKFLLVDDKGNRFMDTVIPKAQRAIQTREDPLRPLENSVTIVGELEPSVDEGVDKSVYGVAMWDDVNPRLNGFDVLVTGLSNGYRVIEDPATGERKMQRKTLRLQFARPGDEFHQNEREIRYIGHEWLYQ